MRIVLVTSWRPRWCGIAIYSADLVHALRKAGVFVEVICHTDGAKESGVHPILDIDKPDWADVLSQKIIELDPDLVHFQHEYGIYTAGTKLGYDFSPNNSFQLAEALYKLQTGYIPSAITYHSVYSQMTYEEAKYIENMHRLSTATIAHEPFQVKSLAKYFKIEPNAVFPIPHGAWANSGIDKNKSKIQNNWQDKLVVGMIGFIEDTKGFDRIINLWSNIVKKIPNALLVIQGDTRPGSPTGLPSLKNIEEAIEKSPVKENIEFKKELFNWPENNRIISGFDVLALPYRFASQSGNLAHGYGVGLPIIASNMEGVASSMKSSRAGILAKTDKDFEKAIIYLLKNSRARNNYAKSSLNYGKKIDWEIIAKKHINVYKIAIEKNCKLKLASKKYLKSRTHV